MNITDWLIGISALATLALAIAAFMAIRQTRRIRAEDKESDFRRRCLDDIRNWTLRGVPLLSEDVQLQSQHDVELLRNRLEPSHAEKEGMFTASISFDVDFRNAVFKAVSKFEIYFDQVSKMAEGSPVLEATQREGLMDAKEETRQSFTDLLEPVTELGVKLRL